MPALIPGIDRQSELLLLKAVQEYADMEKKLKPFIKNLVWPICEKEPFIDNWHIDAYCEHLEALAAGDIRYLIVNVPFRTTKSTIFSVGFHPWVWIRKPSTQFLTGSYASKLAHRDTGRARRVIQHPSYQAAWGDRYYLGNDPAQSQQGKEQKKYKAHFQNLSSSYENSENGSRNAFGFDTGTTGMNSDILGIDDPYPLEPTPREVENVNETFGQVLFNRQNNPKTWGLYCVMYRYGQDDLTQHLIDLLGSSAGFVNLVIPMEYDPSRRHVAFNGWTDSRTVKGEVIDPHRFTPEYIALQKEALGEYGYLTKCQQLAVPRGGGEIKIKDLVDFMEMPQPQVAGAEESPWDAIEAVQHWDTAGTDKKTSAYWCGMHWMRTRNQHYFLCDMMWAQMPYDQGRNAVGEFYRKHNPMKSLIENKSTGIAVLGEKNSPAKW